MTTRRALLLAAVSVPALAACRVRLEDDAPHVPLVPTREPVPDEAALLALLADLRTLHAQATALRPPRPQLVAAHAQHVRVIESALSAARVPSPSSSPSTRPVSAPALPAHEAAALTPASLTALGALTTDLAATVRSIAVYRALAAASLGAPVRWPALPTTPPTSPDAAVRLLAALRSAQYALQLAATRSGPESDGAVPTSQRGRLVADSQWLAGRCRALVSLLGDAAPPAPLGYPLPFPVATPADAKRLAAQSYSQLELAIGATLAAADGAACAVIVQTLAETMTHGAAWGLALTPFPGLRLPTATTSPTPTPMSTSARS